MDSAILEDIKARLQSRNKLVILEFANKEDKSREGSGIDRENNGENKDNQGFNGVVLLLQQNLYKY